MACTLKIDGIEVSLAEYDVWPSRLNLRLEGISTLTLTRKGGPTIKPEGSLVGKSVQLLNDGTPIFTGDIVDLDHQWTNMGWQKLYQCRCLRNRADREPFTDSNTLTDVAFWNLSDGDPLYLSSRAGKNVGEILKDALTMPQNAAALNAMGIGGYTSMSPPTLPSQTLADLALLTTINPKPAQISGGKLFSSLQSYLGGVAPNHVIRIDASGVIRVLDMRDVTENVLTLGVDPVSPTPLKRSIADCYQRVLVRGMPIAEPQLLSLSNGMLAEDWAWGDYATSEEATAAWTKDDFERDSVSRSTGTCTFGDTVTAVLTSEDPVQSWPVDAWDQSNRLGSIMFSSTVVTGVTSNIFKKIVSNTALAAGGTSDVTLDSALPSTDYDHYAIYGASSGASFVYRRYKITDPAVAAALARKYSYPFVWVLDAGGAGTVESFPVASVLWSQDGNPPYQEQSMPFIVDTETSHIIFYKPTYMQAGDNVPSDVRFFAAVNTGELTAVAPSSGFEGTSHTIEGLSNTLTITSRDWIDPINTTHMTAYAQDILDSVKNTMVDGTIVYNGLYTPALNFGGGVSITGDGYLTGWEGLNLPITDVEVLFNSGAPWAHTTTMALSNRRATLTSGDFLRPSRNPGGQAIGNPSGAQGNQQDFTQESYDKRAKIADDAANGKAPKAADKKSDEDQLKEDAKRLGWG